MSLSDYHQELIATVAHALGDLNRKAVYVGGAVVGLYADDPAAQSPQDKVTCRFRYENTKVDVMATQEIRWAPANPWFEPGFEHLEEARINDISIQILSSPYFLASKLTAFKGRATDPRTSHDLEDVIYVLDNRSVLAEEITKAPEDVFNFLSQEFKKILNDELIREAVFAHFELSMQVERFALIEDELHEVIERQ